jgi:hypothetical protein
VYGIFVLGNCVDADALCVTVGTNHRPWLIAPTRRVFLETHRAMMQVSIIGLTTTESVRRS